MHLRTRPHARMHARTNVRMVTYGNVCLYACMHICFDYCKFKLPTAFTHLEQGKWFARMKIIFNFCSAASRLKRLRYSLGSNWQRTNSLVIMQQNISIWIHARNQLSIFWSLEGQLSAGRLNVSRAFWIFSIQRRCSHNLRTPTL